MGASRLWETDAATPAAQARKRQPEAAFEDLLARDRLAAAAQVPDLVRANF
jgi:hypothetical protein